MVGDVRISGSSAGTIEHMPPRENQELAPSSIPVGGGDGRFSGTNPEEPRLLPPLCCLDCEPTGTGLEDLRAVSNRHSPLPSSNLAAEQDPPVSSPDDSLGFLPGLTSPLSSPDSDLGSSTRHTPFCPPPPSELAEDEVYKDPEQDDASSVSTVWSDCQPCIEACKVEGESNGPPIPHNYEDKAECQCCHPLCANCPRRIKHRSAQESKGVGTQNKKSLSYSHPPLRYLGYQANFT
jgi:hypothetical protein